MLISSFRVVAFNFIFTNKYSSYILKLAQNMLRVHTPIQEFAWTNTEC